MSHDKFPDELNPITELKYPETSMVSNLTVTSHNERAMVHCDSTSNGDRKEHCDPKKEQCPLKKSNETPK